MSVGSWVVGWGRCRIGLVMSIGKVNCNMIGVKIDEEKSEWNIM